MPEQCSRCDFVEDCLDRDIVTLEDVADVVGVPAPSLHTHLLQHKRDDLLSRMTHHGQPLAARPSPAPIVAAEVPDADLEDLVPDAEIIEVPTVTCGCGRLELDPSTEQVTLGTDVHRQAGPCFVIDPQELIDAGEATPEDFEKPHRRPLDLVPLYDLIADHPSETVRTAAEALCQALADFEEQRADREHLAEIVAQRDALNAEIDEIARRLGDLDEPEPATVDAPRSLTVVAQAASGASAAEIREWALANGVDCPARGIIPRRVRAAFEAAS